MGWSRGVFLQITFLHVDEFVNGGDDERSGDCRASQGPGRGLLPFQQHGSLCDSKRSLWATRENHLISRVSRSEMGAGSPSPLLLLLLVTTAQAIRPTHFIATKTQTKFVSDVYMNQSAATAGGKLTRKSALSGTLAFTAALSACSKTANAQDEEEFSTTSSGIKYKVLTQGTGAQPNPGQNVACHYTGWLDNFDSSKKFDSSYDRRSPLTFPVGTGRVIKGWDETVLSMRVGEKRRVVIPSNLGYGDRGAGGIIPPGATLYFDMELLRIL